MRIDKLARLILPGALCAAALLTACGGGGERKSDDDSAAASGGAQASQSTEAGGGGGGAGAGGASFSTSQLSADAGRKVVTVTMETDEQGNNKFTPNDFEVHRGDVVRYTLKSGVHNVHFLPDSNKSLRGYPMQPSDMLQLPGQTIDVKVDWPEGKYYFQCDPHAALGMVAHMEVED